MIWLFPGGLVRRGGRGHDGGMLIFLFACTSSRAPEVVVPEPVPVAPSEPATEADARFWTPGDHGPDDVLPETGTKVLALCGAELVPGEITIELVHHPMVDAPDEKTGRRLTGPCEAALLFGDVPGLKAGPVKVDLHGALPEPVTILGATVTQQPVGTSGYAVALDGWPLVSHEGTDGGMPSVLWGGDLDGDGKADLVIDESPKYSYALYALYLSSAATDGPVGRVGAVRVVED